MNMRPPSGTFRPPYLAPLHGGQEKNPRTIDRDVTSIGRARGCDIVLDSQEVSTIHCIIYRQNGAYRIRDSGSRTGVRINGTPIKNSPLNDGDIVVVGPFSFECALPKDAGTPAWLGTTSVNRISQSRRRLAALALKFRRRLRSPEGPAAEQAKEMEKKAASLKERIRHYDERVGQLEESERELEQEREKMRRDRAEFDASIDRREREMARRLEETEQQIQQKWRRFQEEMQAQPALPAYDGIPVTRLLHEFANSQSEGSPNEIDPAASAQRLQKVESDLLEREAEIIRLNESLSNKEHALHELHQLLEKERESMASMQVGSSFMAEQEKNLRSQCDEIRRMMDELRGMQRELRQKVAPGENSFTQENVDLRESLRNYEQRLGDLTKQLQERDQLLSEKEKWGTTWESQASQWNEELHATRRKYEEAEKALADSQALGCDLASQIEAIQKRLDAYESAEKAALAEIGQWQEKNLSAEGALADTQAQLASLRLENEKLKKDADARINDVGAGLKAENDIIYQMLKERDAELARLEEELKRRPTPKVEIQDNGEIQKLEQELAIKEALVADLRQQMQDGLAGLDHATANVDAIEELRAENDRLARRLRDMESELRRGQQAPAPSPVQSRMVELEQYENELNNYRRQLDEERTRLNNEIDQLRFRNEELEEASREMEMELSRERAKISQERQRLDRLRDEIRSETDRFQREITNREAFAGVQKLREELKQQVNPNKSVNERLKNLKSNLSDSPS